MLVQIKLRNVLSFKDETILDMTAVNVYKEHPSNLIEMNTDDNYLKVAAIYGANASGKSNLVFAMRLFQRIVIDSISNTPLSLDNSSDDDRTALQKCYIPFGFEKEKENSEYEIVELIDGVEYTYGFEFNAERIVGEWLYYKKRSTNRQTTVLERTAEGMDFGYSVRAECDGLKSQIPKETLVLSLFNKLNLKTPVFRTVYKGILDTLIMASNHCENTGLLDKFLPVILDKEKELFLQFLSAIDTGIKDMEYQTFDENNIVFSTLHFGRDGQKYALNLWNESEGTIKSIMLYIYVRQAILSNRSLFIDELNIKLHPLLLKFIVDLFYSKNSAAQLIYTTHDATLMDKRFFRRDQIWFVQKDQYGYSELYSLSDFKIRSDSSFEKDYLSGVYGGIPDLSDFEMKEGD